MIVNPWLALRNDAQALMKTRLDWDEEIQGPYVGPVTDRQRKVFAAMVDRATVQRLFRIDNDGGRDWTLWNVYFNEAKDVLLKIQAELDQLAIDFSVQFRIGGAWHFDGRQVGTQFTFDVDGNITGVTGTPIYPFHSRLLELMPDIVTHDIDGNEISRVRPTDLSDVNRLQGQTVRNFS